MINIGQTGEEKEIFKFFRFLWCHLKFVPGKTPLDKALVIDKNDPVSCRKLIVSKKMF